MSTTLNEPVVPTEKETEVRQVLAKLWWMPLVRGILLILFGLLMLKQPGATLLSLIIFLGAYWLVGGVFDLVEGIMGRTGTSRTWLILGGILSIIAGFIIMNQPILSGLALGTFWTYLFGFMTIAIGSMHLFAGRASTWSWGSFFLGILYIIFGMLIVLNPLITETFIIMLLPFWAITAGVFAIVAAFVLRSQGKNA